MTTAARLHVIDSQNPDGYGRIGGASGPARERPYTDELQAWLNEAAAWVTVQMRQKYRQSMFADYADFDAKLFEAQLSDVLSDAAHDVFRALED